jgi:hypothetical protein
MNSIIASTQLAFIKGRNLVDGGVVINEVIDMTKKTCKDCMIIKVDFEKTYHSVDWSFLDYMLWKYCPLYMSSSFKPHTFNAVQYERTM